MNLSQDEIGKLDDFAITNQTFWTVYDFKVSSKLLVIWALIKHAWNYFCNVYFFKLVL